VRLLSLALVVPDDVADDGHEDEAGQRNRRDGSVREAYFLAFRAVFALLVARGAGSAHKTVARHLARSIPSNGLDLVVARFAVTNCLAGRYALPLAANLERVADISTARARGAGCERIPGVALSTYGGRITRQTTGH
jgi:hypothetical protein